jgi:uncharacterized membrane-anchored protein YjiN (DUF445 family)
LKTLGSFLGRLIHWIKAIQHQISTTISNTIERIKKRTNPSSFPKVRRWFDFRRLSPRQKIIYYYIKMVENSAESGWKRKLYQTPAQFEQDLKTGIPEAAQEVEGITSQFIEARYSQHPIPEDRTNLVQLFWRRIMRALHSRPQKKKGSPPKS